MNSFRLHIPAYVDIDDADAPPPMPFETTADLLALPSVQHYKDGTPTFSHFAMSDHRLMLISDDGFQWQVVGFIAEPDLLDLPMWDGGKTLVRLPNGHEVVRTDVVVTYGTQVTLRDGTVGTDVLWERKLAKQARASALRDKGICPRCEVPYAQREEPTDTGHIRIRHTCPSCGGGMTTYRRGDTVLR